MLRVTEMRRLFILAVCLLYTFTICAQQKKTIDLCDLIRNHPVAKLFRIPSVECIATNKDVNTLKKEISQKFQYSGTLISINSCLIEGNTFAEAVFKSKKCDTVAVLFLFDKKKKVYCSQAYKIEDLIFDFRWTKYEGEIVLYRRIIGNYKSKVSASFSLVANTKMIHASVEDGLSKWGSLIHPDRPRKTIVVCDVMSQLSSSKTYDIPKTKSVAQNKNLSIIRGDIRDGFNIDGTMMKINSFSAYEHTFVEVVYKTKKCDTVAMLFHWERGKGCIASKPYKIAEGADFRISKSSGRINLYRKVMVKGKKNTAAFAYDVKKGKMDNYLYSGVSKW